VADLPLAAPIHAARRRPAPRGGVAAAGRGTAALATASTVTFLSVVVLLPIAALLAAGIGPGFLATVTQPEAVAALEFTIGASLVAVAVDLVAGLAVAWVLVRDDFRGRSVVDAIVDLPFALPTIVAGLTLLTLYGPTSPVGLHIAFTRGAIVLALCFVTLPFVIRTVQPVLIELDVEMEEAARSLGAGQFTVFRRIVLPNILPGILSGSVLALARALGEIGSLVLIAGTTLPTQVASVQIFNLIQDGETAQASALAIVLLGAAFVLLLAVGALRFYATRYERA
jgi:sulfate transport system permease protein